MAERGAADRRRRLGAAQYADARESIERNRLLRPVAHRVLAPVACGASPGVRCRAGSRSGMFAGILFPFAQIALAAMLRAAAARQCADRGRRRRFITNPLTIAAPVGRAPIGSAAGCCGSTPACRARPIASNVDAACRLAALAGRAGRAGDDRRAGRHRAVRCRSSAMARPRWAGGCGSRANGANRTAESGLTDGGVSACNIAQRSPGGRVTRPIISTSSEELMAKRILTAASVLALCRRGRQHARWLRCHQRSGRIAAGEGGGRPCHPAARTKRRSAPSASTWPAWTRAIAAGQRFLRLCQRHLGEEHADPRRQIELRRVQRAVRPVARAHARTSSKAAKSDPEFEDRHRLCDLLDTGGDRRQGAGADQALARPDQGADSKAGLSRAARRGARATASAARSAPASARTTRTPKSMRWRCASPASACPTAIII